NPRLGFIINGGFLAVGTLMTAVSHVYYKLHPTAIAAYVHPDDIAYFVERGYFRTYVHCASYCVGLTVGYILATRQKFHIPLSVNIAGWLAAFTLALSVLYGVYEWNLGHVPSLPVSTLYNCTNKLVWALALAWVTIACVTGNGGIATTILSWQAFVPLARLTYMAYLVHPLVQFLYLGSTRTLIIPDHRSFMFLYLANILLGYMCAFGMSLLFESPFMALEKVLFATRRSKSKSTEDTNKDTIHENPEKNYSSYIKGNGIYTINIKPIDSNN
ncbi:nose resistant to fluoxetine protein 6, partial [Trichonephila clavata]